MVCQKRGFMVWCLRYTCQGVSWGRSERSEHKRPSGMVLEVCTEWRNPKLFQSYPWCPQGKICLNPHLYMTTKNWFASESTPGANVSEWSGKLGPGAAWGIKLFFYFSGTSVIKWGEDISEDSTHSGLVTHGSFITGKIYDITHKKDAIHWALYGCISFAKFYCTENK